MKNKNNDLSSGEIPLFRSWRSWYILVLVNHLVMIILFYMLMKFYG